MVVRYSERQSIELHVTKVAARRDRVAFLSALLDRVAVGTVRRQAGLSNQYPPVELFFRSASSQATLERSAAERMGIDDESDQVT